MLNLKRLNTYGFKARFVPGLLAFCVVCIVSFDSSVWAQSSVDTGKRLNRLENELQTLSRAVFRGETPPEGSLSGVGNSAASADLEVRLQQMERELSEMLGKIEEVSHENRQLKQELARVSGDLDVRMDDLERAGPVGNGGVVKPSGAMGYTARGNSAAVGALRDEAKEQTQGSDADGYRWNSQTNKPQNTLGSYTQSVENGAVVSGGDGAAASYENAFALLKGNKYDEAQIAFEGFLSAYPDHVLVGNAKYWLGETFYVRGEFEPAARLFAEGYQKFPKGAKAADNLLKLGMSLSAMGKSEDACIALGQIGKDSFSSAGPVLRRAKQEKTRLGCAS